MTAIVVDQAVAVAWMRMAATRLDEACPLLTDLDAARGDADHGVNMQRGFAAIVAYLDDRPPASAGETLVDAAAVLRRTMGGTSGPLWSAALRRAGKTLGASDPVDRAVLAEALAAMAAAVAELGGAREGDNTMLDALLPASRAFAQAVVSGESVDAAAQLAADSARAGAAATAGRAATKGRASYLGARGVGKADPGAASAAIVIEALADALRAGRRTP